MEAGAFLQMQQGLGKQEIHKQRQGVHDGGDKGACHHRRVQLYGLGGHGEHTAHDFCQNHRDAQSQTHHQIHHGGDIGIAHEKMIHQPDFREAHHRQRNAAQQRGADYLGIGAVHATGTKTDANPLTWQDIRDITASVSIPTTAIGGIKLDNMLELQGTGVDGVAIVSGIFAAEDIENATKALLAQARKLVLP